MNRKFRLRKTSDIQRVRRSGKSYAHPLIVLVAYKNHQNLLRIGITAGKSLGNAVTRNLAKRRIREIMRPILLDIKPGWDLMFLARKPAAGATYSEIQKAVLTVLERAKLIV